MSTPENVTETSSQVSRTQQSTNNEKIANARAREKDRSNDTVERASNGSPKIIKYPNNLGTNEQPHSINFYISQYVPGADRETVRQTNNRASKLGVPSARTGNEVTAENADGVNKAIRTTSVVTGAIAGAGLGAAAVGGGGIPGFLAKFLGAGAGAEIASKITRDATGIQSSPAVRMREVISLHIPQSPQAKYGATFENEAIGTLLGTVATGGGDVKALMQQVGIVFFPSPKLILYTLKDVLSKIGKSKQAQ